MCIIISIYTIWKIHTFNIQNLILTYTFYKYIVIHNREKKDIVWSNIKSDTCTCILKTTKYFFSIILFLI